MNIPSTHQPIMTVRNKLTKGDYIKTNLDLLYTKPIAIIITVFGILCLLQAIVSSVANGISLVSFLYAFLMLGILPATTYLHASKRYSSSKRKSEMVEYKFEDDFLVITGESFVSRLSWDKIIKVTKRKNWIFIWHDSRSADAIPLRCFTKQQIDILRFRLVRHKVRNNI